MRAYWKISLLALILAALGAGAAVAGQDAAPRLKLDPALVKITAFYDGARVLVSGQVPAGDQAVVVLSDPAAEQIFRVKDQVAGLIWMNRGSVSFDNLPKVYMLRCSGPLEGDSPVDAAMGLGRLRGQARVVSEGRDPDKLFGEFVKIKTGEGLYDLQGRGVKLDQPLNGRQAFSCAFELPAKAPQGSYRVKAMAIDGEGNITDSGQGLLEVRETGLPALLSELAFDYGLLYGVLAVLIALGGGMVTSMLFRGGGGAH